MPLISIWDYLPGIVELLTLFWPFYFLEPQFAGSTFHHIVPEPDSGDVIHQLVPTLEKGDSLHDVACKVVLESTEICIKLLMKFSAIGYFNTHKQQSSGKNFLERDFPLIISE